MMLYKADKNADPGEEDFFGKAKEIAYWRKANQIFGYLEKKVALGNNLENCKTYEVTPSMFLEFYDDLVQARLSRDTSLFPTTEGFFFGSTEVDKYYWDTLLDSIDMLAEEVKIIKEYIDNDNLDNYDKRYYYYASW